MTRRPTTRITIAATLAFVGLLESLLTANLLDDITDTPSDKDRETRGQGIANILSLIPYEKPKDDKVELPKRSKKHAYDDVIKPAGRTFVPQNW